MAAEAMLQLGILILTLSLFFVMHSIHSQTTHARTRTRNKTRQPEPNRHLVQATRHLARARSTTTPQHARTALVESDRALSISPRDPSAHILRARSLNLMGHRASAIRSLDFALSPPAAKSLCAAQRVDALVERAELKMGVNMRRRVDSAMADLKEAMGLSRGMSERSSYSVVLCLLGKCYEWKGMKVEAEDAFREALDVDPDSVEARNGLDRLDSNDTVLTTE